MSEPRYVVEGWELATVADFPRINAAEDILPFAVWDTSLGSLVCACPDEAIAARVAESLNATGATTDLRLVLANAINGFCQTEGFPVDAEHVAAAADLSARERPT